MNIDVNLVFYLVEALLIGLLLGIIIGRRRSREKQVELEEKREVEKPGTPVSLEEVISVDKALAVEFYRNLKKAIKEKKIRIALVSELCPKGRIAYDFAIGKWICVEKDGTSYPLGENPVTETIEYEDDVADLSRALGGEG